MKQFNQKQPIQSKRITIYRETNQQPSPISYRKSINFDKSSTIHVRRHSIAPNRNQPRDASAKEPYPLSYQSSKEIKSVGKYRDRPSYDSSAHPGLIISGNNSRCTSSSKIKNSYGQKELEEQNAHLHDNIVQVLDESIDGDETLENQKTQKFSNNSKNLIPTNPINGEETFTYLSKKYYQYLTMIGKGGFGKVWRVRHLPSSRIYALKEMSKATIIAKRSVDSILNERHLLATLHHQFIVNMVYAFQDRTTLYLLMEIQQGGDLRYHLAKKHKFSEAETRFIVATIILSLEYLHKRLIIHRDVKPENIVFDEKGYAHLTDMGIAKFLREENYEDTSGTPGYMAPEVMFHHNHRFEADFFALGVIMYEIMIGKRPYLGKNRQEIKELILAKQVLIAKKEIPENWTLESADFANKLLQRRPIKRLGWGGIEQLKQHRWLKNFPWAELKNKTLSSPFTQKYNPHEVRYRVTEYETQFKKLLNKNKEMLGKGNLQEYFTGYTFGDEDGAELKSKEMLSHYGMKSGRNTISSLGRYN